MRRNGSIEFKCSVVFVGTWKRRNRTCTESFLPTSFQCWLTHRSTGPIAACRHLGYKSLAQIPAHRNGPVSSNVSHHRCHSERPQRPQMQVDPRPECPASNTKRKDAILPLVLFTAATECEVSFISTALRRGKNPASGIAKIRKICLSVKCSEKYVLIRSNPKLR